MYVTKYNFTNVFSACLANTFCLLPITLEPITL